MLLISATPVVGLPQLSGWSQVSENGHSQSARLFCAFGVSGSQAGNVGRDIADLIMDSQVATSKDFFEFLTSIVQKYHQNEHELYLSACLVTEKSCSFATFQGSVLLKRDSMANGEKRVGKILASGSEVKMIEGSHQPEDVYVLSTDGAGQFLSEVEQKLLQGYDSDTIVTSVVPGIHALEDSSLCAIAFVTEDVEVPTVLELPTAPTILTTLIMLWMWRKWS
jgi:hypothetical protein